MNFGEEYALKQHEERCRNFTESNKAAIGFSKMALRGAFLLNGSAAIGIMYAKALYLDTTLTLFALGALVSAVASGMSYVVQYLITMTWQHDLYKTPTDGYPDSIRAEGREVPRRAIGVLHVLAIALVLGSYILFSVGVLRAYPHLSKQAEIYQEQAVKAVQQPVPKVKN